MLYTFLSNILEPFSYFIYSIVFFLQVKTNGSGTGKVLLFHYLLASFLMVLATWKAFHMQDNRWLYNLLCIESAVFICYYFYDLFTDNFKKRVVMLLLAVNLFYFGFYTLVLKQFENFNSFGFSLLSASVSIMCFIFFYDILRKVDEKQIWYNFNYWLVSGYLFYFLVSFAIFLMYHHLTDKILDTYTDQERELLTLLWIVHNVLLFLSAITPLFGHLWIRSRNRLQ